MSKETVAVRGFYRAEAGLDPKVIVLYHTNGCSWNVPGGKKDPTDADAFEAIVRETKEELGIDITDKSYEVTEIGAAKFFDIPCNVFKEPHTVTTTVHYFDIYKKDGSEEIPYKNMEPEKALAMREMELITVADYNVVDCVGTSFMLGYLENKYAKEDDPIETFKKLFERLMNEEQHTKKNATEPAASDNSAKDPIELHKEIVRRSLERFKKEGLNWKISED